MGDIDLNVNDFVNRVNADLVGKLANHQPFRADADQTSRQQTQVADDSLRLLEELRHRQAIVEAKPSITPQHFA